MSCRGSILSRAGVALCLVLGIESGAALAAAPNDPFYQLSWHHQQIGSEAGWQIAPGSRSVTGAVIDTGIDASHPELAGHIVPGWNFVNNSADTLPIAYH